MKSFYEKKQRERERERKERERERERGLIKDGVVADALTHSRSAPHRTYFPFFNWGCCFGCERLLGLGWVWH